MTAPDRAVAVVGLLSIAALLAGLAVALMPEVSRIVARVPRAVLRRLAAGVYGGSRAAAATSPAATSPTDTFGGQA